MARLWSDAKAAQTRAAQDALSGVQTQPGRRRPWPAAWRRSLPGYAASATVHLALLVVFGALTLTAADRPDGVFLRAIVRPQEDPELLDPLLGRSGEIELEPSVPLAPALEEPGAARWDVLPDGLPAGNASRPRGPGLAELPGGLGGPFGNGGDGSAQTGEGRGGAEFFGLKAEGNRFAFVVDGSVSMARKWEACRRELLAAVGRLKRHQLFYVTLFNNRAHPMFSDEAPEPHPLPATPENIARLKQWLDEFPLRSGTRPLEAMKSSLRMHPDAIYFLTDGELHDDTQQYLSENNKRKDAYDNPVAASVVHAIGFHAEKGRQVLQQIAEQNAGDCTFVGEPQEDDEAKTTRDDTN